jgi:hypothetical protein
MPQKYQTVCEEWICRIHKYSIDIEIFCCIEHTYSLFMDTIFSPNNVDEWVLTQLMTTFLLREKEKRVMWKLICVVMWSDIETCEDDDTAEEDVLPTCG